MKLLTLFISLLLSLPAVSRAAEDWQLETEEEGVQVYISQSPDFAYKSFRGVTLIKADMKTLGYLQENLRVFCAWLYSCKQMRLLKYSEEAIWVYLDTALPWPAEPRDMVLKVTSENTPEGGVIRHLEAVPDYLPEVEGRIRVRVLSGIWQMTPKTATLTEVVYQMRADPGGNVPSWLANRFVVDAPLESLRMLKVVAEHQTRARDAQ